MASQAAPSIKATMQGVAYTNKLPEPTSAAVSSRSTKVDASPFIPTIISIFLPPDLICNQYITFAATCQPKKSRKGIAFLISMNYNQYIIIERGASLESVRQDQSDDAH
jgi:hypothetical protein